jgi:D-glycero-D-manno-heptose 1,7-bisphosphate phosphatase
MTKLLILDKDGTIVRPASGCEWVQHPTDQELIPGVTEAISQSKSDGWEIAIASNQGGCHKQKTFISDLTIGQHVWNTKNCYMGVVTEINSTLVHCGDQGYSIRHDSEVLAAWKTVDQAITEMRYAMNLASISAALFAPTIETEYGEAVCVHGHHESDYYAITSSEIRYRKPHPGMILHLQSSIDASEVLFIGDRPEDQESAINAGVAFQWAADWRGGE